MTDVIQIQARRDISGDASIEAHLDSLRALLKAASRIDPLLMPEKWLISTGERAGSYLYPVFEASNPNPAALAVLKTDAKKREASAGFAIWNGQEDRTLAASVMALFDRKDGGADFLRLTVQSAPGISRFQTWNNMAEVLKAAVALYSPLVASVSTPLYDGVFKDKPGVGWMLYLPRPITAAQVPEARALVPVMGKDEKGKEIQLGTIVVSVTDEPFSDKNPEHVKVANAIEIRLVDQDLLPRFLDM